MINRELGLPNGQPLCISCVTGQGIKDLWRIILEACEGHVGELRTNVEQGGENRQQKQQNTSTDNDEDEYFDDDADEIAYSQGYDWIQDSVMYEAENGNGSYEELHINDYHSDDGDDYDEMGEEYSAGDYYEDNSNEDHKITQKETLKYWKRKAREMERRGEL